MVKQVPIIANLVWLDDAEIGEGGQSLRLRPGALQDSLLVGAVAFERGSWVALITTGEGAICLGGSDQKQVAMDAVVNHVSALIEAEADMGDGAKLTWARNSAEEPI